MIPEEKSHEETPRTDIKATIGEAGTTVKEGALSSPKGVNEMETLIVTLVRKTVSYTLKATGSVADETVNVTRSVLQGTFKAAGSLGNTAVKAVMDVLVSAVECVKDIASTALADVAPSLRQVFSTPPELQKAETAGIDLEFSQPVAGATQKGPPEEKPALTPENSIQDDKVICLECGKEMRQLKTNHLISHGLSLKEYKKKYGFAIGTPLAAKSFIEALSKAPKKRGLPEKLTQLNEPRRKEKTQAPIQAPTKVVPAGKQKPMLTPENSIQNDKVICLECGAEMIQLTVKHLVIHGMDQKEYRQKYGFSMKTPLAAKSLVAARSQAAKEQKLSEKRKHHLETGRQAKAEATTQAATEIVTASKPKRTRIRKKKA
jgi:predicted transcriptional regulator